MPGMSDERRAQRQPAALAAVEADREAVRLVAQRLQHEHLRAARADRDRVLRVRQKDAIGLLGRRPCSCRPAAGGVTGTAGGCGAAAPRAWPMSRLSVSPATGCGRRSADLPPTSATRPLPRAPSRARRSASRRRDARRCRRRAPPPAPSRAGPCRRRRRSGRAASTQRRRPRRPPASRAGTAATAPRTSTRSRRSSDRRARRRRPARAPCTCGSAPCPAARRRTRPSTPPSRTPAGARRRSTRSCAAAAAASAASAACRAPARCRRARCGAWRSWRRRSCAPARSACGDRRAGAPAPRPSFLRPAAACDARCSVSHSAFSAASSMSMGSSTSSGTDAPMS